MEGTAWRVREVDNVDGEVVLVVVVVVVEVRYI
jgi:hypothetical protein